ncbi:ATP-dependent helicase (plasmid) [Clostridium perfringens]|uniref:ATP-dependent helicase n=1 Tax=Clostridium perfringens TaxID=1502 RepID=UPI000B37E85B|nr:ATP-dependent helicase [Clostridium perfringens]EGT0690966.1 ATP-dependent helicase [Clostridium perfringens]EGT0693485.1 ATP-dependent helicase [Clostridium perfringens]EGT0697063.1 ATP-dependent helicase [Clostridium perfringens]MDU3376279.1 ATP-dependent helicase [Clostridium perfringens]MDU3534236.1 ATP-dependent helicase [Clostridium perfringens]
MKKTLGLNENQSQVVLSKAKKIVLIACAGSGKTLTVTRKVGQLIDERVSPDSIYCISFTRAAARELQSRICKLTKLGKDVKTTTFHSFVIGFMQKYCNSDFNMINDSEKEVILDGICKRFKIKNVKHLVKAYKKSLENRDRSIQYAINEYLFKLNSLNLMDIDILLPLFLEKISEDEELLKNIQSDIEYLFYDEAQDMNDLQYEILRRIIPPTSDKGFMLIGDDDQNIYQWNDTDIKYILDFPQEYKAETFVLDENYRCSNQIIAASNNLISKNETRYSKSIKGFFDSDKLKVCSFQNEQDEIMRLVGLAFEYRNTEKTLAILCRSNNEIKEISKVFKQVGIAFNSSIKTDFNRDNVDFLKLIVNPKNDLLVEKVIGVTKDNKIKALDKDMSLFNILLEENNGLAIRVNELNYMARTQTALQIFNTISTKFNLEDAKLENAIRIWTSRLSSTEVNNLGNFLDYIENKEAQENLKEGTSNVNLTTIHGSKGLEFNEVVLFNFHNFNYNHKGDIEETRRLLYVAMTRAKEKLSLYFPKEIIIKNHKKIAKASSFINELRLDESDIAEEDFND